MARHLKDLTSVFARWSSRVFSVELDGAPLYFGLQEIKRKGKAPQVFSKLQNEEEKCYSLLVCSSDRIKREKFYWELKDKLLRNLPPGSATRSHTLSVGNKRLVTHFLRQIPTQKVPFFVYM